MLLAFAVVAGIFVLSAESAQAGIVLSNDLTSLVGEPAAAAESKPSRLPADDSVPQPFSPLIHRFADGGNAGGMTTGSSAPTSGAAVQALAGATHCEIPALESSGRLYAAEALCLPVPPANDLLRPPQG